MDLGLLTIICGDDESVAKSYLGCVSKQGVNAMLKLKLSSQSLIRSGLLSIVTLILGIGIACSSATQSGTRPSDQSFKQTADDSTIRLGMSHERALTIIRECGGEDITSTQAIIGPDGHAPLSDIFWNLEPYNAVLEIGEENGKVTTIYYWTADDYGVSKLHRVESRKSLGSLTFEKQTKTVKTELL